MANDYVTPRGRRLSCLFLLIVGLVLPMVLKLFWIEEAFPLSYQWDSQRRSISADDFIVDDYAHSDNDETGRSSASNMMMLIKQYRRISHGNFTTMKGDGHYLSNIHVPEFIEHQMVRKRMSIHAIVTTIVALIVPLTALLYALIFNRKPQRLHRTTKRWRRREQRKERIIEGLKECRIQLPTTKNSACTSSGATTTTNNDEDRDDNVVECPICLSAFAAGEIAIASKYCQCSCTATNTNKIAAADNNNQRRHRIYFHEECIATWLSQRRINPKKLCPCCRQPFLSSSLRKVAIYT